MRRGLLKILVAAVAAFTFGVLSAPVAADTQASRSAQAKTLAGAWLSDITPTQVPAFTSLGTFSEDGTLTNISSSSMGFAM